MLNCCIESWEYGSGDDRGYIAGVGVVQVFTKSGATTFCVLTSLHLRVSLLISISLILFMRDKLTIISLFADQHSDSIVMNHIFFLHV